METKLTKCFALKKTLMCYESIFAITCKQARNQLGTPGGAKSFLRGAQIF